MDEIKEECGVFGIYQNPEAASLAYFGLHALQHRGQEGAGIATADGKDIYCFKGRGLLASVFEQGGLAGLKGGNSVGLSLIHI